MILTTLCYIKHGGQTLLLHRNKKPNTSMEFAIIKKWTLFFIGILCAIMIAEALSNIIVSAAGIGGWMKFLANIVLYAVFFFTILYVLEKIFRIEFFGFWRE